MKIPQLIILLMVLSLIGSCTSQPTQVPTLGVITPLTGFGAYWGSAVQKGMLLAQQDFGENAIRISFEDSQANPLTSATAAHRLIDVEHVQALYVDFTAPSQAVAPIAAAANTLLYYNTYDEEPLIKHPNSLKVFLDTREVCNKAAQIANQRGFSTIAYIGPAIPIVPQCLDELRHAFHGNLLVETTESPATTDYKTALLKLKDSQLLISLAYENNYLNIQQQKIEMGYHIPLFCTAAECYSEKLRTTLPAEAFEGNVLVDFHVSDAFKKRYLSMYLNATVIDIKAAAFGYDAVQYVARAGAHCPTLTADCLREAIMSDTNYVAAIDSNGFQSNRKQAIHTYLGVVSEGGVRPV